MKSTQIKGIVLASDVYHPVIDGVTRVVENIYLHYKSLGIDHFLVCPNYPDYQEKDPNIIRLPSIYVPGQQPYRMVLPFLKQSMINIVPENIDIVHIHSPFTVGKYLYSWAKKYDKPTIYTFHSKFYDKLLNNLKIPYLAKSVYRTIINFANSCNVITVPSKVFADQLVADGLDSNKITINHNGIDLISNLNGNLSGDLANNSIITTMENTKTVGKPILLYVGQLIKEKNPDFLVRSLRILLEKGFEFLSVIVGTGDYEDYLKKLVSDLGLSKQIIFTGKITDKGLLNLIYQKSDFFVFPSTYEVQPLVLFEAAHHGLVTIGIEKASGVSEFVKHQHNGFLVPKKEELYAQQIIDAWSQRDLLKQIGANAQQEIPISAEKMILGFENIYLNQLRY